MSPMTLKAPSTWAPPTRCTRPLGRVASESDASNSWAQLNKTFNPRSIFSSESHSINRYKTGMKSACAKIQSPRFRTTPHKVESRTSSDQPPSSPPTPHPDPPESPSTLPPTHPAQRRLPAPASTHPAPFATQHSNPAPPPTSIFQPPPPHPAQTRPPARRTTPATPPEPP